MLVPGGSPALDDLLSFDLFDSGLPQKLEFRNNLKWLGWTSERLARLINQPGGQVPNELGRLMNVSDSVWLQAHEPWRTWHRPRLGRRREPGSKEVGVFRSVAIAFHSHDRICDHRHDGVVVMPTAVPVKLHPKNACRRRHRL